MTTNLPPVPFSTRRVSSPAPARNVTFPAEAKSIWSSLRDRMYVSIPSTLVK
jgi:hypothetical protein